MIESGDSHLSNLRLSDGDFASLRENGFVRAEPRGAMIIFKLRFRCRETKRQCVRYIGTNQELADAVGAELKLLQQDKQLRRDLRRMEQRARRVLRETKRRLEHLLLESGFHFHGLEIRRQRSTSCDERLRSASSHSE